MATFLSPEAAPLLSAHDGTKRNDNDHGTISSTRHGYGKAKAAPQGPVETSGWRLFRLLIFTWLGSFLAAVDTTMTSTMSATISDSFGSLALIGWLGSAYLIANAAVQPLSGKLTDIFGRRTGLLFSSAAFAAGNIICGVASSQGFLILGRAVAGIGGGGLNSVSTFVATDVIPLRKRGLWQGFGMLVYSSGIGLGGVVGGAISDAFGWRWSFLLLCPLTLMSAIGVYFSVPASLPHLQQTSGESFGSRIRRIDLLGSFLLVAALFALLFGLDFEQPRHNQDLPDPTSADYSRIILFTLVPISAVLFGFFALAESRAKDPIIPLTLLANRTVLCTYLASFFASITLYTLMFNVPLYLQARGATASQTGLLLLPQALGSAIGSLGAGLLMRLTGHYTYSKPAIQLLFFAGAGGFAASTWSTPLWIPELALFANGLGMGGTITTMTIAMIAAIDHDLQAVATGALFAFRTVGSTVGVAGGSLLLRSVLGGVGGVGGDVLKGLPRGGCHGGGAGQEAEVCGRYEAALRATFLMAFGAAVAAFGFGVFVRNATLASSFEGEGAGGGGSGGEDGDVDVESENAGGDRGDGED